MSRRSEHLNERSEFSDQHGNDQHGTVTVPATSRVAPAIDGAPVSRFDTDRSSAERAPAGRRSAGPFLWLAALVLVAAVIALLTGGGAAGRLNPESYDPEGSHALSVLLSDGGVRVLPAHTVAAAAAAQQAGPPTTLLVTEPDLVPAAVLQRMMAAAASTVLVAPTGYTLSAALPDLTVGQAVEVQQRAPGCGLPAAGRAGAVTLGGYVYRLSPIEAYAESVALCYPAGTGATLARVGNHVVLGDPELLLNRSLDDAGNAALALGLLGEHPDLVWFQPDPADPGLASGGHRSLTALLPTEVTRALLQLAVGLVLIALWRGRRLGPLVVEPLPVVVRAAEATEGLAALYRRAGARDRAAAALREAAAAALGRTLGCPTGPAAAPALVEAVAARTGRDRAEVAGLLLGGTPPDDVALVRLADALDELTAQVRGGAPGTAARRDGGRPS
jgi:hypothetical protein